MTDLSGLQLSDSRSPDYRGENMKKLLALALTGAGCMAVLMTRDIQRVSAAEVTDQKASTEVAVGVTERSSDVSMEIPLYVTIGVVTSDEDPARKNKVLVPEGYAIKNTSYKTQEVIVTDVQVAPFTEKDPNQEGKYKLSKWQIVDQIDPTKNEREVVLKIGGVQIPALDRGTEDAPAKMKSIWESSVANAEKSQFFDKDKMGVDRYPIIGAQPGDAIAGITEYAIEAEVPAAFQPAVSGDGGRNYTAGIMNIRYTFSVLVDDGTGSGNKVIQNAGRYNKVQEYNGPIPEGYTGDNTQTGNGTQTWN